jgi:hypothetical protein
VLLTNLSAGEFTIQQMLQVACKHTTSALAQYCYSELLFLPGWQVGNVYQASGSCMPRLLIRCCCVLSQVQAHLQVKKSLPPGWLTAWLQRPLDQQLLEYAVCDVLTILALYEHFRAAGVHVVLQLSRRG